MKSNFCSVVLRVVGQAVIIQSHFSCYLAKQYLMILEYIMTSAAKVKIQIIIKKTIKK